MIVMILLSTSSSVWITQSLANEYYGDYYDPYYQVRDEFTFIFTFFLQSLFWFYDIKKISMHI